MSPTASSYKDRDTEETLDIYFYRPVGLGLAHTARFLKMTPNAVTVLSGLIGVLGGHLFYYPSMSLTILGIALLIFSDALDSADGQLARITGRRSEIGRILDGLAGNLVFLSIYVHLCLRYLGQPELWEMVVLAVAAAVFHSFQSALADYFRNGYLYFVRGASSGELHSSREVQEQQDALSWRSRPFKKLLVTLYGGHARQQELMAGTLTRLKVAAEARYGGNLPAELREQYRDQSKPLIKYYNILTINTRMIALFVSLLLQRPYLYFIFELTVLNAIFLYVIVRQERISARLLGQISAKTGR